ncbi:hypothetical protein [Brevibacillus sp. MS2.2]|uniref:hypothetical protein n=1 Tax=Brevibacillus sp. MS2.2 TaxID=2738981 RepID=UPI0020C28A5E|nr:hypothetical protein [Brevibacillus sp. MS2.2]
MAFAFWFFILLANKSLLSSDIPLTLTYVRFTHHGKIHIFLSIPTLLWGLSTAQVFTYQYHPYDALMSVIGFIFSAAIMFFSILMQRKSPNTSLKL